MTITGNQLEQGSYATLTDQTGQVVARASGSALVPSEGGTVLATTFLSAPAGLETVKVMNSAGNVIASSVNPVVVPAAIPMFNLKQVDLIPQVPGIPTTHIWQVENAGPVNGTLLAFFGFPSYITTEPTLDMQSAPPGTEIVSSGNGGEGWYDMVAVPLTAGQLGNLGWTVTLPPSAVTGGGPSPQIGQGDGIDFTSVELGTLTGSQWTTLASQPASVVESAAVIGKLTLDAFDFSSLLGLSPTQLASYDKALSASNYPNESVLLDGEYQNFVWYMDNYVTASKNAASWWENLPEDTKNQLIADVQKYNPGLTTELQNIFNMNQKVSDEVEFWTKQIDYGQQLYAIYQAGESCGQNTYPTTNAIETPALGLVGKIPLFGPAANWMVNQINHAEFNDVWEGFSAYEQLRSQWFLGQGQYYDPNPNSVTGPQFKSTVGTSYGGGPIEIWNSLKANPDVVGQLEQHNSFPSIFAPGSPDVFPNQSELNALQSYFSNNQAALDTLPIPPSEGFFSYIDNHVNYAGEFAQSTLVGGPGQGNNLYLSAAVQYLLTGSTTGFPAPNSEVNQAAHWLEGLHYYDLINQINPSNQTAFAPADPVPSWFSPCATNTREANSEDPNSISASPVGVGGGGWLTPQPITYVVNFQNDGSATAENVRVSVALAPGLDASSLQFGSSSQTSFPGTQVIYDPRTRTISWMMDGVDLQPAPVTAPTPQSEGWVSFTATPVSGLPSGTSVTESASVNFDFNPAVETAPVTRTLDEAPPTVNLGPLPASTRPGVFSLSWSGSSAAGIASFTVYESVNGGVLAPVLSTEANSASLDLSAGNSYGFAVQAVDRVGLSSPTPVQPVQTVSVTALAPTTTSTAPRTAAGTTVGPSALLGVPAPVVPIPVLKVGSLSSGTSSSPVHPGNGNSSRQTSSKVSTSVERSGYKRSHTRRSSGWPWQLPVGLLVAGGVAAMFARKRF